MTREELEATGMTDGDLVDQVEKLFGVALHLERLERVDPERAAKLRAMWFANVTDRQEGAGHVLRVPKMGALSTDAPDEHFGPDGIPGTGDEPIDEGD